MGGPVYLHCFNPRPRAGANKRVSFLQLASRFQSTPPRGGERAPLTIPRSAAWFQSTPPRGGEHADRAQYVAVVRFQSTPPRGGEPAIPTINPRPRKFQSTPPRGGEQSLAMGRGTGPCFNPRPRAGANAARRSVRARGRVSIHAPARGRTAKKEAQALGIPFQSTPPRGGEPPPANFLKKKGQIALQREASTFRMTCHYAPGAGSLQLIDPAGLHDSRESPRENLFA